MIMNKLKITNCKLQTNSGIALFIAVLMASIALAIGAGVLNITLKQMKLASFSAGSTQAFFAADTGLECALKWDLQPTTAGQSIFGYYSSAVAPISGLTGYWKLNNDGLANEAVDSSGFGNDGTLVNSPTWNPNGKVDGSLSFNGVNDYVSTGVTMSNFITAGESTISVWIKPMGFPKTQSSVYDLPAVLSDTYAWIGIHRGITGGLDRIWVYNYDTNIDSIGVSYAVNTWINIVLVHSGGNLYAYKDGNPVGAPIASGNTGDLSESLLIGKTYTNILNNSYFNGEIDDIRVYNRALSATDVQDLYDATAGNFSQPVGEDKGYSCFSGDITNKTTGWDPSSGWDNAPTGNEDASITFDIGDNTGGPCASVIVTKSAGKTTIDSRGYNTCDPSSGRRVERGIRLGPF
jgi:hypothetical protein